MGMGRVKGETDKDGGGRKGKGGKGGGEGLRNNLSVVAGACSVKRS